MNLYFVLSFPLGETIQTYKLYKTLLTVEEKNNIFHTRQPFDSSSLALNNLGKET